MTCLLSGLIDLIHREHRVLDTHLSRISQFSVEAARRNEAKPKKTPRLSHFNNLITDVLLSMVQLPITMHSSKVSDTVIIGNQVSTLIHIDMNNVL